MLGLFKRKFLSRKRILTSVPWRNERVQESRDLHGGLLLTLPRGEAGRDRILSLFLALPRQRTFAIEEMGEWVWRRCDGKHTVDDIAHLGAKKWSVGLQTARQAVFRYTGILVKRGLLSIEVKK